MNDEKQIERIENDVYISVKDHFAALLTELDKRVEQALKFSREAVGKADAANERRLGLLNEFRQQSSDESKKYALKESTDTRISTVETQIARLYGGLIVVAVIGVANLVKLFWG